MALCLAIGGGASTFMHGLAAAGGRAGPAAKKEVGRWLWRLKTRNAIRELQISTARLLKYLVSSVEIGVCSSDGTLTRSSERLGKCEMGSPKAKRLSDDFKYPSPLLALLVRHGHIPWLYLSTCNPTPPSGYISCLRTI